MMFKFFHLLIEAVYLICPVAACLRIGFLPPGYLRRRATQRLRFSMMTGCGGGVLICVAYAFALNGRLIFTQLMLTSYLATSFILVLQLLDRLLWVISRSVFWLHRAEPSPVFALRAIFALLLRASVLFCVGIPFVLATVMTYRPRVGTIQNPQLLYQWTYQEVQFPAIDGGKIAGWWIPARGGTTDQTVLLCPGENADKAAQLSLVKHLVPDGYNVLVFDFRAHGESGGQLCSFGDLERNDVLGAVRWLRTWHRDSCKKIAGLGVSSGAAALLAAAADPSAEGQNIDAIAVYDTYDRLDHAVDALMDQFVPAPLNWFVDHVGLPIAGCEVGANLQAFSPASDIKSIWPRPVLVIHGIDDEFIPFNQGQSLYDAALQPKTNFWIDRCGHAGAIKNDAAARLVERCFDSARRVI
jgi:fermentation-respiration switch protein FrsA (DUF1100 family)